MENRLWHASWKQVEKMFTDYKYVKVICAED